ncbi:MAG: hypothetical protein P8099_09000 [Gemmatimonadota bacterium]|jgi:membrane protein implicated in regulation of membrane protease activity
MLRRVLLGIGIAGLLVGGLFLAAGLILPGIQLLVMFGVLTVAVAFERWRYVRSVNRARAGWQATGERFVDPGTGRLTEVYYNPDTGEREYRLVDGAGTDRDGP